MFTSGGSEANNLAIKGTYFAATRGRAHIITSTIEHPAVLAPCSFLERLGASVTYLPVDRTGLIDPEDVRRAITPQTLLISIMRANNEVGTVRPLAEIGAIAREHGIHFHTDAAQSVGKIPTNVRELGVDMLTIAGHKLYAPKGVGARYVRRGFELEPAIHGAGHESGRRAGTESALLAVGLGTACAMAIDLAPMNRVQILRDRFWQALQDRFGEGVALNGHPTRRLPNTLNVSFVGRIGADILGQLHDVAASTGSACHSGQIELSPVLADHAGTEENWNGSDPLQPGKVHHIYRDRCCGRTSRHDRGRLIASVQARRFVAKTRAGSLAPPHNMDVHGRTFERCQYVGQRPKAEDFRRE
ncbi:cysteine desulfurase [Bradyrhizobium sp. LM2.7]